MNRLGQPELQQYVALAHDRHQTLRELAHNERLARLARRDDLPLLRQARRQLGRLLVEWGRRLQTGLEEQRPLTLSR